MRNYGSLGDPESEVGCQWSRGERNATGRYTLNRRPQGEQKHKWALLSPFKPPRASKIDIGHSKSRCMRLRSPTAVSHACTGLLVNRHTRHRFSPASKRPRAKASGSAGARTHGTRRAHGAHGRQRRAVAIIGVSVAAIGHAERQPCGTLAIQSTVSASRGAHPPAERERSEAQRRAEVAHSSRASDLHGSARRRGVTISAARARACEPCKACSAGDVAVRRARWGAGSTGSTVAVARRCTVARPGARALGRHGHGHGHGLAEVRCVRRCRLRRYMRERQGPAHHRFVPVGTRRYP
jgi:hypothetical protein